jgi:hypothetical protein
MLHKSLLLFLSLSFNAFIGNSTTCLNANVIPNAAGLPYSDSLVCGLSNDINSFNTSTGFLASYLGGLESVYTWTPDSNYTNVSIEYSGVGSVGIFVFLGCPTSGGTLVQGITGSGYINLILNANLNVGTQYYIVFDTWPSPASPCPGSFTISGVGIIPCAISPSPGNTLSSMISSCPDVPFILSLQNNPPLSGYTYQWQISTDSITWTNIVGATNATYSAVQTTDHFYRCRVMCSDQFTVVISVPILVSANSFIVCYCASGATSTNDEDIFNVTISTLNNSSTCFSTGGPGSIPQIYSNYTNLPPTPLNKNGSYPTSVQIGTCSAFSYNNSTFVWIDYNQNGLFSANELVYSTPTPTPGPHVESFTVFIPQNALLGTTRMRVKTIQASPPFSTPNPCGTFTWGETEDYMVNILPTPPCQPPINLIVPTSTTISANFAWTPAGTETKWQIQVGTLGFTLGTGSFITTTINPAISVNGFTPFTFYEAYVRAICGPGDTSVWSLPVVFNTYGIGNYMETNFNCHPNGFMDITNSGTSNVLSNDAEIAIASPFPIYFQATIIDSLKISNNGVIDFNPNSAPVSPFNSDIISLTPNNGAFPFWDDLDDFAGEVLYEVQGVLPNRRLIVQWNKKHDLFQVGDTLIFQVIFEESTGKIFYQYENSVAGNSMYDNRVTQGNLAPTFSRNRT